MDSRDAATRFVLAGFWILLRRAPGEGELRQSRQLVIDHGESTLLTAMTSSPEFLAQYRQWQPGRDEGWVPPAVRDGLASLGDDRTFVGLAYRVLFGREADAGGLAHYAATLADGASRRAVLQVLATSSEFAERVRRLNPGLGRVPRDVQLCELANPAKWDNPDWIAVMESLVTLRTDIASMHRKSYEFTQLLFGLRRLGALSAAARVLSVGAGHEPPLYWLARETGHVYATDLYDPAWGAAFGGEGHASVLSDPAAYAPFDYPRDRLTFLRMDGSRLAFADGSFDIVYSLSSIEHFGGFEGARRSVADMARVLRRGGILALATEWCVRGEAGGEVFSPEAVRAIIDQPDLELVEPIDDRVWDRYETEPVDLRVNRFQTPHMLLRDGDTIFTSVMIFLRRR